MSSATELKSIEAGAQVEGLPEGWTLTTIGEVCQISPPKPRKDALPAKTPVTFVPMAAVDAEQGAITAPQTRTYAEVRQGFTSFTDDDVIMAKITPCMENGKAAIARNLSNGVGFGSTEFHVLRSMGAVLPEYVYHFIRQERFRKEAEAEMTGSVGQKRVPQWFLENTRLALPPRHEQQRIIDRLASLQLSVKTCRDHLYRVATILTRFRQSVLAAACSGELTADWRLDNGISETRTDGLPRTWRSIELAAAADVIDPNPSHRYPSYQNGTVPILATEQFKGLNDWDTSSAKLVNPAFHAERCQAHGFRKDDIIFARKGRLGLARRPPRLQRYVFSHTLFIVRTHAGILSDYLLWFLRQDSCVAWLTHEMNSNTGVPTLGKSYMERLPVDLPTPDEQREIVKRVQSLFDFAERVEEQVYLVTNRVNRLQAATSEKAFRGELVPTEAELARREGREYEPASVLLERIKAHKNSQEEKFKRPVRARAARAHV